jgi:3-hydroxyacyl-CoA dehydrogenase/enoyl-CoA hydratase/3-hydroxybutyryl-CoA epimerase
MAFFQCKNLWVTELDDGVAALVLDRDGSKTNLLAPAMLDELEEAFDRIAAGRFQLLILRSAKPASFAHGPDPHWLADHATAPEMIAFAEHGQRLCQKLVDLPIPIVAVIAGACLGTGLELALACDYRVVVERPATLLGFTQIELGLIPCWGGTQRLPRLIGLEASLKLLTSARRVRPAQALALGLADARGDEDRPTPPEFLAEASKRDWSERPRRTTRQRWFEAYRLGRRLILRGARRVLRERLPDDMPAPWEALAALVLAVENADLSPGLEYERQAVGRLADTPAFHNLLQLRLERDHWRAEAARPDAARYLRSIGVVGATDAGIALTQTLLVKGCQVVLHDADKAALGRAALKLHQAIMQDDVRHGTLTAAAALKCLRGFRGTASWEHFDRLDLVLDTREDGQRHERFRHLDTIATPATILASTGAVETVSALRRGLRHPERVAVLHFAGPPGLEALAELARPADVAEPVARGLEAWAASLGKVCAPVADRPGLLFWRVWLPALNEAALLLREGMQLARIDESMDRFGVSPGPLELMDRFGLDNVVRLIDALRPVLAPRLKLEDGFAEMARRRLLGVSAGAGFYRHAGRKRRPNPSAVALWWAGPGEAWLSRTGLAHAEQFDLVQRRLIALMVIEAYHCLGEGIVADALTLDFAMVTAGWAPHRGGPLTHACQLGPDVFIQRLEELARDFGPRFTPPPGLRETLRALSEPEA